MEVLRRARDRVPPWLLPASLKAASGEIPPLSTGQPMRDNGVCMSLLMSLAMANGQHRAKTFGPTHPL